MNNRYKFRVYSKLGGEFHYFDKITFYSSSPRDGLLFHNYYPMKLDNSDWQPRPENYVIQQFTGLQDKNKKDLYEGDLVKVDKEHKIWLLRNEENQYNYTCGEIKWLCEAFKVCQKYLGATYLGDFATCNCCPCGLIKIGNIFENPELLLDKNKEKE